MSYDERDVSGDTSLSVNAVRTSMAVGAELHTTAGAHSLKWLQGDSAAAGKPASADYLINRDGSRYKITPAGRYAYHAGQGQVTYKNVLYRGDAVSQLLIGIELEALPNELITREQYFSLAELLRKLAIDNQWAGDYPIYGHYATARPTGRRSDPTNFDWGVLVALLR